MICIVQPASILSLSIQSGQTPLIITSFGGYHHLAREFIAAGANIDHQDNVSTYGSENTLILTNLTAYNSVNSVTIAGWSDSTN